MSIPSWRDWLFSVKAFIAAIMALFIALSLDLPRPYWAMAAVYVVANPLAGATSSKGLYRALGTLLGATASVILVPLFVNAPELLSVVVALWTGTLLFISMLDRTSRSYVFMLAGYSLPLIALPTVGAPETVFDVALARSEEIIIGIVCASVVSAIVFPSSVGPALGQRISSWLDDAGIWADEILRGEGASPATPLKRQKLAADVSGLDLVISQLRYDAGSRDIVRHSRELRGRLLMLLPLFSSLADRLHALKAGGKPLPQELVTVLNEVADWLGQGGRGKADDTADSLLKKIGDLQQDDLNLSWDDLVRSSALDRLKEIVDLWQDCLTLRDQIVSGRQVGTWRPAFRHRNVVGRSRHYDYALLAFSAGAVVVGIAVACFFWIYSGWQDGAGFVTMAAVACSFFASLDRPAPFITSMFIWCAMSLLIACVYIFGILPSISGFEMLVLVFAPPFLVMGLLIPRPQTNMLAMLLAVNGATFIALQDRYTADFASFANSAIAALAGVGFALVWTLLTRPFGAELAAWRLVRAGWTDLAETAAGIRRADHERLSGRILDRLGQLVPRLAGIEDRELKKVDGYADVRLGFNVLMLQKERGQLSAAAAASVSEVLIGVSDFYRSRLKAKRAVDPSNELRVSIDHSLEAVAQEKRHSGRASLDALVGLRRALFPHAEPPASWRPPLSDTTQPLPIAAE
ncbi:MULTISPECIES: FUSC family protein [unclassified Rhizobium]|uniref:FUSC family protein n=1 Tax=unclassified Rhizobium TaxID=2613769 RepID=UPI000CDF2F14|nr:MULTISPECIES: FUSC family protein [Rhizobium]AVA21260.1 fusaric acid resistance-like protein [Rhizobium sp. NXC24]MDK4737279.1 FUSC family protein [Rhizobium sp. CNPSo 3464]UWU22429.1 FUSC family protein [Rhizobium tropici]